MPRIHIPQAAKGLFHATAVCLSILTSPSRAAITVENIATAQSNQLSIAIDRHGDIHAAFIHGVVGQGNSFVYMKRANGSWSPPEFIDRYSNSGYSLTIAVDTNNRPHVVYHDGINHGVLKYATRRNGRWIVGKVDSDNDTGKYPHIAVDAFETPHISYTGGPGNALHFRYATLQGSVWVTTTIASGFKFSDVELDSRGLPQILGNDAVYSPSGGVWTRRQLPSGGTFGSSMAIDSEDRLHLALTVNAGFIYLHFASATLRQEVVIPGIATGSTDIAIDGEGIPHIVYPNLPESYAMYSSRTLMGWINTVANSEQWSGDTASLGLPANGIAELLNIRRNISSYFIDSVSISGGNFASPMGGNSRSRVQAPGDFRIAAQGANSVTWAWTDNSNNELGFRLMGSASREGPFEVMAGTDVITANQTTYVEAGLNPSSTFYRYIAAVNAGGIVVSSGIGPSPAETPPLAVPTLSGTALSTSRIRWDWSDIFLNSEGRYVFPTFSYRVFRGTTDISGVLPAGTTSWTEDGLMPNQRESGITVQTFNSAGSSASLTATRATLAAVPGSPLISSVSTTSITIEWANGGNSAGTRFEVEISTSGTFRLNASTTDLVRVSTGLTPGTSYFLRVRALNDEDIATSYSTTLATATLPVPPQPGPLTAMALGVSSITWGWPPTPLAARYRVSLSTELTTPFQISTATSATLPDLSTNTRYGVQVVAENDFGDSIPSSAVFAYTKAAVPAGLTVLSVSYDSVDLTWSTNTNPSGTTYGVQAASDGVSFVQYMNTSSSSGHVSPLLPHTTYLFRVLARNGDSLDSPPSQLASTVTTAPPPSSPASYTWGTDGPHSMHFTWTDSATNEEGYRVRCGTVNLSGDLPPDTTGWTTSQAHANTSNSCLIEAFNDIGTGQTPVLGICTAAEVPSGLSIALTSSRTANVSWNANGNPAWSTYDLERTIGNGAPTVGVMAQLFFIQDPLMPEATHTFRVRTRNFCRTGASAYTPSSSIDASIPRLPVSLDAIALGTDTIEWRWSDSSSIESGYRLTSGAVNVSGDLPADTTRWLQVGLSSNSRAGPLALEIFNIIGSTRTPSLSQFTWAASPGEPRFDAVHATSATVSWEANGNPPGTLGQLTWASFTSSGAVSGSTTSLSAKPLIGCTTYSFSVQNFSGGGIATGFSASISTLTRATTPDAPTNLQAVSLPGAKIALSWEPSATEGIIAYRLYTDSGTGTIDYANPVSALPSGATFFTASVGLSTESIAYGLRSVHRCGIEETNLVVVASAASAIALEGVRTSIVSPLATDTIAGSRVTVVAEPSTGLVSDVGRVRFEFKASSETSWHAIVPQDLSEENPDSAPPFFIHWDVTSFQAGNYDVRARATDRSGRADATPPASSIRIDPTNPTVRENDLGGGRIQRQQTVSQGQTSNIQAAGGSTPLVTTIVLPAGALNTAQATLSVTNDPASPPPMPSGAQQIGVATEIQLSNGQTLLAGGQTAEIGLSYRDENSDGMVDGTTARVDRLKIFSSPNALTPFSSDFSSVLDRDNHRIIGRTSHFSFFALFTPAATSLNAARVYPVPFIPNDGDADNGSPFSGGNPNSGIIFDNLPPGTEIEIFDLTGQQVARIAGTTTGAVQWDVHNEAGEDVASGGYFAVLRSPGLEPIVKQLMVIR